MSDLLLISVFIASFVLTFGFAIYIWRRRNSQGKVDARTNAEIELKAALKRTELLFDVAKTGIFHGNLSLLLQDVVEKVAQDLPADRASLIIFDTQLQAVKHFVKGGPGSKNIILSVMFEELMEGLSGWAIRTGESALSPKDVLDPRESQKVQMRRKETNCGSILVTPLQYQNSILGTLTLINQPDEPDFTVQDMELVEAVANQISSAIVKVELEENLHNQNKFLATLHQIALDLLNKRSITELLQSVVDEAVNLLGATFCEIMLMEDGELVVKAYTENQPYLENDRVGRDDALLSWQAVDTKLPAIVNDYSSWANRRDVYNETDIGAVVAIPILSSTGVIGVFDISRRRSEKVFDHFEIQTATLFAQLVALALENLQLQETLRHEAIHDPLTGLYNRRFMQEALNKEIERSARKSSPISLVVFDLDHLKRINDTLGHDVGDEALRKVGQLLKNKIRSGDVACRFGGDEFAVIMSDTAQESAKQRMEEIQERVKTLAFQVEGMPDITLSLSIGIAEYPDHGSNSVELFKAADLALYKSKQSGRDQINLA